MIGKSASQRKTYVYDNWKAAKGVDGKTSSYFSTGKMIKGTRCLGSVELVHEKRLKSFVVKSTWLERCLKSRI